MQISIIIPTLRDNEEYLKICVESIKKYSHENHEIIVATNNGEPWDVPIDRIKIVHNVSQGQGGAVNKAVKEAKNKYILINDDDAIFSPNWEELIEKAKEVEFLSGVFVESGKKGGIAPAFIHGDYGNTPDEFDWDMWEKESMEKREEKLENGFGFPLVCKKELWEVIEGYDENFDPWGSNIDSDLNYKVMLRGIKPKRWRGVLTYHFAQVSGTFKKPEALPYWDKNTRLFEQKWNMARARSPEIWFCDFKINGDSLRYKPEWAKLKDNPNINYEKSL